LPLEPGTPIGEVAAVVDVFFPRLMWTRRLPANGEGVPRGAHDRRLMGVTDDGLMLEAGFRQDRLDGITLTDLELTILNDDLPGIGKARKALVLQEKVAALKADPLPF